MMGCLCFGRDNKHGIDGSGAYDSPPKPTPTTSNGSGDRHQRSSASAPIAVEISGVPKPSGPSVPSPTAQPKLLKEGLSLLASPRLGQECKDTYDMDVVAIHGLDGHPRDTWTYSEKGRRVFWLNDFLPKALPGARIFTYGYNSELFWSRHIGNIDTYARGLLDNLQLERQQSPAQSSRPIAFICHSLGGLVCKKSLVIANEKKARYQSILDSTKAIFFFGTPHHGSKSADYGKSLAALPSLFPVQIFGTGKIVRRELLGELSPGSPAMISLCQAFVDRAHEVPCIKSFHESETIHGETIVSQTSATIGVVNEQVIPVPGDHCEMCRIKDERSMPYRMIVGECKKLCNDISQKSSVLNAEEQQCLDSLALSSFREPSSTRIPPAKGTCEWILSVQQFNTWRNGLPPVLWISGELGYGKTTLMYFLRYRMPRIGAVVDDAEQIIASKSIVCGFFCDERNKDLANATMLLQGLLWDIVWQRHDLIRHALKYYWSNKSSHAWSYDDLWRIFQAILDDQRISSVCVIIDALDECNGKDRSRFLRDVGEYLERRSESATCSINFILSSRPTITGNLPGLKENSSYMKLDQDAVLRGYMITDIRRFVLDGLLCDEPLSPCNGQSVRPEALADKIATKSEGSFLWASLILDELQTRLILDADDFISQCPPDLYGVYNESLAKVKPDDRKEVVKSLHILLAAKRPLTLAEFKVALAVESRHQTLEAVQLKIEKVVQIETYLLKMLGNLVRISDTTNTTITLRHQSVKDFLLNRLSVPQDSRQPKTPEHSSDVSDEFRMSMDEAENTLAGCCISLLKLEDFAEKRSSTDGDREVWEDSGLGAISVWGENTPTSPVTISRDFDRQCCKSQTPFFDYAASNWGLHYASSESVSEELTDAALILSTRTSTLANWSHQFRRSYSGCDKLPESPDALVVAAYFGHTIIVRKLTFDKNFNSSRSAALTWASRMGHPDIVRILIELGTPCMGEIVDRRSAFSWATVGGFLEIVEMLLGYDRALINVKDYDSGCCPLSLAVSHGHLEVVERLLKSEDIDVNLESNRGKTPIHFAINGSDYSPVELRILRKLLSDPRVDITVRDNDGRSILSHAAELGATSAIRKLLCWEKRQDEIARLLDDSGDNKGMSPLSHAAWGGHSDTVGALCETKKIDSQLRSADKLDGANVFDIAAKRGHAQVIRELGRYYPDGVNNRDHSGRTPLSVAMWGTRTDVLRALLDCGADPNLASFDGKPPVSFGVAKIDLVRFLVERGADVNRADNDGRTPLGWALHLDADLQAKLRMLGARL